jgi:hypothetical protein
MHRRRLLALALLAATSSLTACGGDDGGTGPTPGGSKSMQASVAGVQWTANPLAISAVRSGTVLTIAGSDIKAGTTTQININLPNVTGTGVFQLNPNFAGQLALLTITTGTTPSVWTTALSPATGSISISTLTTERVAGTFSFTAQASPGTPATSQRVVSSGTFDIAF